MDDNINLTILNEISKAAKMGMESISYVTDKIEDENMKESLSFQYAGYGKIAERVNKQFDTYGEIPDDSPVKDKMMSWMGIQMNTMMDKSNSHIAEILIQGNTMGLIESRKLINHNPHADGDVKSILHDFSAFQEENIEKMKEFL